LSDKCNKSKKVKKIPLTDKRQTTQKTHTFKYESQFIHRHITFRFPDRNTKAKKGKKSLLCYLENVSSKIIMLKVCLRMLNFIFFSAQASCCIFVQGSMSSIRKEIETDRKKH